MFASNLFAFLEVRVTPCVTITDPEVAKRRKWNPKCAPAEKVLSQQQNIHKNFYINR